MEASFSTRSSKIPCKTILAIISFPCLRACVDVLIRVLRTTVETSDAVLDLQFCPQDSKVLAVAASSGFIHLYGVEVDSNPALALQRSFQVSTCLVLSLEWRPTDLHWRPRIAFSLSSGEVGSVSWNNNGDYMCSSETHSLEAWTVAWSNVVSPTFDTYLYSGGDDSRIVRFADPQSTSAEDADSEDEDFPRHQGVSDHKIHGAGVTAILPLTLRDIETELERVAHEGDEVILTGSYDEFVRVISFRKSGIGAQVLAEERLDGGVWRLKCIRSTKKSNKQDAATSSSAWKSKQDELSFEVIASCMHAGAKILSVQRNDTGEWSIRVIAQFLEHESMNYGSDARGSIQGERAGTTCVSTSFYDCRLCLWNIECVS